MTRSIFTCYRCKSPLANVRPHETPRTLTAKPHVRVTCTDDGRILMICHDCRTPNQFTWRAEPEPAATLNGKHDATVEAPAGPAAPAPSAAAEKFS